MELSLGRLIHIGWSEVPVQLVYFHLCRSEDALRLLVIHRDVWFILDLEWFWLRPSWFSLSFWLEARDMGFAGGDLVLVLTLLG